MDKATALGSEGVYTALNSCLAMNAILCLLIFFVLFVLFVSLIECFSLLSVLNLVVRTYKRACTFPIET